MEMVVTFLLGGSVGCVFLGPHVEYQYARQVLST